jgi:hypothetical protein
MGKHKSYQGHKDWNHWNVALWIGNEEPLYRMANELVGSERTLDDAARKRLERLPAKTPDGARYTFTSVRAALAYWNS